MREYVEIEMTVGDVIPLVDGWFPNGTIRLCRQAVVLSVGERIAHLRDIKSGDTTYAPKLYMAPKDSIPNHARGQFARRTTNDHMAT